MLHSMPRIVKENGPRVTGFFENEGTVANSSPYKKGWETHKETSAAVLIAF